MSNCEVTHVFRKKNVAFLYINLCACVVLSVCWFVLPSVVSRESGHARISICSKYKRKTTVKKTFEDAR